MANIFPKLESKIGVYLIVSPSGGRYVGSSKRLDKRFNRYKNLSCSRQSAIYASLKKYGYDKHVFSILIYCEEIDLLFWERCFGDIYLSSADFPKGLNLILPGYNEMPQMRTKETNDRVSKTQIERFKNPEERQKTSIATKAGFTREVKEKMSSYWKERCNTDEFRKMVSERQKKYFSSPEARKKARIKTVEYFIKNPNATEVQLSGINKYYKDNPNARSERQLKRFKDNPQLGKEHSIKMKAHYEKNPTARKLVSERTTKWLNENHPRARKVINTETGEIFKSVVQVSNKTGVARQTVRNWLENISPNPTPYKYI